MSCAALSSLNLSACMDVTDSSLLAVGAKCRSLRKLVVPWCHSVTDTGVGAAIGTALEVLNVAGCQVRPPSENKLQAVSVARCVSMS